MQSSRWLFGLSMAAVLALASAAQAVTWTATVGGNWTNAATWGGGTPGNGDGAVINSGVSVTVDVSTASLNSFTNNGTLTFAGWNTVLTSTVVTVNGTITHPAQSATTTNGSGQWIPDNRVYIVCSNLTMGASGKIDVSGQGYNGARSNARGYGPGGSTGNSGGGYGGLGGALNGGFSDSITYGSATNPVDPGSAGSGVSGDQGGDGGGVIRIDATGEIAVNGTNIMANGTSRGGGGGSGGSVFITCRTLTGTSGSRIIAAGGSSTWGAGTYFRGGGGGGRIAVIYDTAAQNAISVPPIVFDARPGLNYADVGTLYFPDNRLLPETFAHSGQWMAPNFTNWAPSALTVTNGWLRVPFSGFSLNVTNGIALYGTNNQLNRLQFYDAAVTCGGDVLLKGGGLYFLSSGGTTASMFQSGGNLVLTNSSSSFGANDVPAKNAEVYVFASRTNALTTNYGARVSIGLNVNTATNCWIYPYSHSTNGGSVYFEAGSLTLATNSGINADGKGYRGAPTGTKGYGPGGATQNAGAGYGGAGGGSGAGITYGFSNAPLAPGSCGGGQYGDRGRAGGGLAWIKVAGNATINGAITANGGTDGTTGGGSGGGIYFVCRRLTGSGSFSANGSNAGPNSGGSGGGGGGGRIAIWRIPSPDPFVGAATALPGSGGGVPTASTGTVVWADVPLAGTVIMVR